MISFCEVQRERIGELVAGYLEQLCSLLEGNLFLQQERQEHQTALRSDRVDKQKVQKTAKSTKIQQPLSKLMEKCEIELIKESECFNQASPKDTKAATMPAPRRAAQVGWSFLFMFLTNQTSLQSLVHPDIAV